MSETEPERPARPRVSTQASEIFPGAIELVAGGVAQSIVDPDPRRLHYDYVRRIGNVVDLLADPGDPVRVLHLGAGGLTLARYVAATRPGSAQLAVEADPVLARIVHERMPLDAGSAASLALTLGDALVVTRRLTAGDAPGFDLAIVDVYTALTTPGYVDDGRLFTALAPLLGSRGVVAVNIADGPSLAKTRRQGRALRVAAAGVLLLGPSAMLRGDTGGNVVLLGGPVDRLAGWAPALAALGPHPAELLMGEELDALLGV